MPNSEDVGITASLDDGIYVCGCIVWAVSGEGLIRLQRCLCKLKSYPKASIPCIYVISLFGLWKTAKADRGGTFWTTIVCEQVWFGQRERGVVYCKGYPFNPGVWPPVII